MWANEDSQSSGRHAQPSQGDLVPVSWHHCWSALLRAHKSSAFAKVPFLGIPGDVGRRGGANRRPVRWRRVAGFPAANLLYSASPTVQHSHRVADLMNPTYLYHITSHRMVPVHFAVVYSIVSVRIFCRGNLQPNLGTVSGFLHRHHSVVRISLLSKRHGIPKMCIYSSPALPSCSTVASGQWRPQSCCKYIAGPSFFCHAHVQNKPVSQCSTL